MIIHFLTNDIYICIYLKYLTTSIFFGCQCLSSLFIQKYKEIKDKMEYCGINNPLDAYNCR